MTKYEDSEDFLLLSSFGALSSGEVYVVEGIKDAVASGDASSLQSVKLDTGSFVWPNMVEVIPQDVFGERAIVVPDGFLVPMKTNGGVYVIRMDSSDITKVNDVVKISPKKNGYFHHMGYWIDMNGDGRKDFITARSDAKVGHGELVWFEHPEGGLDQAPWAEHVVTMGPDVAFEVDYFDQYPGEAVIFAAEFFNEKVSVHRVSLTDGTLVESRTIDDSTIRSAYSIQLVDLNADGKKQLLVNNHETKSKYSGIWAYTLPEDGDLMNGEYDKMTIATGYKPVFSLLIPQMAPGFPYAVWPHGWHKDERAHIFVAGDGDMEAHVLYPTGDNAEDFGYQDVVMEEADGVIGALAFSDLDQDGWTEIWIPNYDKSTVELMKLSDGSGSTIERDEPSTIQDFLDIAVDSFMEGVIFGDATVSAA